MASKIIRKMHNKSVVYNEEQLHSLVFILTESQQWQDLKSLLDSQEAGKTCRVQQKTIKYLRQNLVYCFQNIIRSELQESVNSLE